MYISVLVYSIFYTVFIIFYQPNILSITNMHMLSGGVKCSGCLSVTAHLDVSFCCFRVSCTWRGFGVWRKVRRLSSRSRSPPKAWSVWGWLGLKECTALAVRKDPKEKTCSRNESQRETGKRVTSEHHFCKRQFSFPGQDEENYKD